MKNFALFTILIITISLVSISCENGEEGAAPGEQPEVTKEQKNAEQEMEYAEPGDKDEATVSAEMLWAKISASGYAKKWQHWPGKQPLYKGSGTHGEFLSTYINSQAFNAISRGAGEMPYGSIIVMENYNSDKELSYITVMQKKQGYNPGGGDWFWVKYGPNGRIVKDGEKMAGKVEGCISCHNASTGGIEYIMKMK